MHLEFPKQHTDHRRRYCLCCGTDQECTNVIRDGKMQDVRISTNVTLGSFVFMNTGSKVCHDGKLGNYVTLSPDVTLAGNVIVGDNTEIGMGANVIQGITVGTNTVIGAGSVVVRDVDDHCKAAGVPAKAFR